MNNRSKTSIRSKLFKLHNKANYKVFFKENSIYQVKTDELKKYASIMTLDNNIKFSVAKHQVDSLGDYRFYLSIRNHIHGINLIIENIQDLQYCIKYLGYYGHATGLQSIANQKLQVIGKGNFASVYKLTTQFGMTKALKMFEKKKMQNRKQKIQFQNQTNIMRYLNSPNLASLDCIYQTDRHYYMQMEYFQTNLKHYLRKNPITIKTQKNIMQQLLNALIQLKNKNVIHRDIKPDNVMVRKNQQGEDEFVIIDFGLAQKLDEGLKIHIKCGTPGYIAPQIANYKQNVSVITTACDMFSLGATFFMIITGKRPFAGNDNKQLLYKNKKMMLEEYLFYYMSVQEMDLVNKMMDRNPNKRITPEQALRHKYFNEQMGDNDIVLDQNCDLSTKLNEIKIMDTSFLSQGVVFLYSLMKFAHCTQKDNETYKTYDKGLKDTDFYNLENSCLSQDHQNQLNQNNNRKSINKSIDSMKNSGILKKSNHKRNSSSQKSRFFQQTTFQ